MADYRDLGMLEVSIERDEEQGNVHSVVVARDSRNRVQCSFSLVPNRRTCVLDGPADFGVAIKGERRGPAWEAVMFRLDDSAARDDLKEALETLGT
ncbi:hypothetical protein RQP46_005378 [Phenoliferia psychrophenolica]